MEHHYANLDGIRLHYVDAGEGALILFVHGFPEFWYAWRRQIEEFSHDHHAVALDMRGHNLSDKPADVRAYRPRHLVADLRNLIEHLDGRPCILVAHDWGGAAAWNLAAEYPEYIEKLVIINSPHPVIFARELRDNPAQIEASRYMLLLREARAERLLAENDYERLVNMLRLRTTNARWLTEQELKRYREAWAQPGALDCSLNYYRASPLHPATPGDPGAAALTLDPAAFKVQVPTLVIWGERDTALLPALLDGLDEFVANLTIERIPDGSHWVVHEHPDAVNRLIREFIK